MCVCAPSVCVYSAPRSRPGSRGGGSGARRGEDGGAAGRRAGGEGGPGVTAAGRENSASPNLLPSPLDPHRPLGPFSTARCLRGSRVGSPPFRASRKGGKWSPRRRRRREGRPGYSLNVFTPAVSSCPPPHPRVRGEAAAGAWAPRGPPAPQAGDERASPLQARLAGAEATRKAPARRRDGGRWLAGSAFCALVILLLCLDFFFNFDFFFLVLFFRVFFFCLFFCFFYPGPEGFPSHPESGFWGWGRRAGGR